MLANPNGKIKGEAEQSCLRLNRSFNHNKLGERRGLDQSEFEPIAMVIIYSRTNQREDVTLENDIKARPAKLVQAVIVCGGLGNDVSLYALAPLAHLVGIHWRWIIWQWLLLLLSYGARK